MRNLWMLVRHLFAILVLPFVMAGMIPHWIQGRNPPHGTTIEMIAGSLIFAAGFGLFLWCLSLFAFRGKGTLAPWDPPKHLVIVGPYVYMRNPMITGVITMIIGQAVYHRSLPVALWAAAFFVFNQIHFLVNEEPGLERRFGEEYREYKRRVPRWFPRFR